MKFIEAFNQYPMRKDWKTLYTRYRLGRLKHQYWLWNRKHKDEAYVDKYDYFILKNCQPGKTLFYASAGYYLRDIFPEVETAEMHSVVETFYKDTIICTDRSKLAEMLPYKYDNFAVVNNRADHWVTVDGLTDHLTNYTKAMNDGCRVFYSFRDTQIHVNRLTTNMEDHFLSWAKSLTKIGLSLVWYDIRFDKKVPGTDGEYNTFENPDPTNGNLKFIFVYKGQPWEIQT